MKWCQHPVVINAYDAILPDVIRMLNVYDVKTGIWEIPRMVSQVQVEYRDSYEIKSEALFNSLLDQCELDG